MATEIGNAINSKQLLDPTASVNFGSVQSATALVAGSPFSSPSPSPGFWYLFRPEHDYAFTVNGNTSATHGISVTVPAAMPVADGMAWTFNMDGTSQFTAMPNVEAFAVRTADRVMVTNEGGIANKAVTPCDFTLPTTAAAGTVQTIDGLGATGWTITGAATQIVHMGSLNSIATGGVLVASANQYDCITLRCVVADKEWVVESAVGNPLVTTS